MAKKDQAREVCEISRTLMEKGLVARTWGNISVRTRDNGFLITPSGRPYETLKEGDIVRVSMDDLSYTGTVKPSSEKNLHQVIYMRFPKTGAVIHTHQPYASSFGAARKNLPGIQITTGILKGKTVACAPYALPTTKKLALSVKNEIEKYDTPAMFLANHGAVCWGKDLAEALKIAEELEKVCKRAVLTSFFNKSGVRDGNIDSMLSWYIAHRRGKSNG